MGKVMYFGKVNINDPKIYEIYKGIASVEDIMERVHVGIKNKLCFIDEIPYEIDGEEKVMEQVFSFTGISRLDEEIVVGGIVKTATIYIKKVDRETGERSVTGVENDELINFCFYPKKEIVMFDTTQRFGYKTFCKAFGGLLNQATKVKSEDEGIGFHIALLNEGLSLDEIKVQLKKIKNIETLTIDIIPPNPSQKLLDEIRKKTEKQIKDLENSRATEKSIIFKTKDSRGLDTTSSAISKELDNILNMHSSLEVQEATAKGYVKVTAKNKVGNEFNTSTKLPKKYRMPDEVKGEQEFAEYCKNQIILLVQN